jgi:hypothetical protein
MTTKKPGKRSRSSIHRRSPPPHHRASLANTASPCGERSRPNTISATRAGSKFCASYAPRWTAPKDKEKLSTRMARRSWSRACHGRIRCCARNWRTELLSAVACNAWASMSKRSSRSAVQAKGIDDGYDTNAGPPRFENKDHAACSRDLSPGARSLRQPRHLEF